MSPESDISLLQQFVTTQDPVAFDELARRYRGMVFSIARRVTQNPHDADDVAQNVFLELARKAASIRISIPAFLHSTATRRAIDLIRDQQRRRKYETKAAADRPEPVEPASAVERSWEEISPEVDHAIDRLPDEMKTLVILYFLRGLTIADIALETGLNRGMIERRLHVGVRRLRADLAKGGRVVSAGVLAVGFKASLLKGVPASLTAATGRMALVAGMHSHGPAPAGFSGRVLGRRWIGPAGAATAMAALITLCALRWNPGTQRWLRSNSGGAGPAVVRPYDEMSRLYATYLPKGETSGFALHAAQMKDDTSSFWRGSQVLFYEWCKSNCRDWLDDARVYAVCHASPNLEDAERLSVYVNTDNSARLPIQLELLQGMIVARLASDRTLGSIQDDSVRQIASALCQSFRAALLADQTSAAPSGDAADVLTADRYVDSSGALKRLIFGQQDKLLAYLRPAPMETARVQRMLADAVFTSPSLREVCGSDRPRVRQVAACIRRQSVVTQGQLLLVVQLADSGTLLELKQQAPSPAELAGAVQPDGRSDGQRAAEDAALLSPSAAVAAGWCTWDGRSFTVVPLNLHPQVYELRKGRWVDPVAAARCWADATAVTHRRCSNRLGLAAAITPELELELVRRSDSYLRWMNQQFQDFRSDPRVARDRANEDALAAGWLDEARR